MESYADLGKKIAETLNWKVAQVEGTFDIDENKQGFFVLKLKPKKFLDKPDFIALCKLVKGLGGEDYLQGARAWKVAGPLAKKPTLKAEETSNPIDEEMVASLKGSSAKIGHLYPVLVDSSGNTIDGFHRRKANPNWPTYKVEFVSDPLQLAKARLIANERRDVPAEEKRALLDQIAKMTGWTPKQIAEDLGWNERTVYRYLSAEHKNEVKAEAGRLGGSADNLSAGMDKSESSANLKPQDMSEGQLREFLDSPRAREVLADMKKEAVTEEGPLLAEKIAVAGDKKESLAHDTTGPLPELELPKETKHSHKVEGVQAGEFTCPECKQTFFIDHISATDHRLTLVREVPE